MSIEVPVLEVLDLADRLRATGHLGTAAEGRLLPVCRVGDLAAPLGQLFEGAQLAARALAVETGLLGDLADGAVRSWSVMDAGLLSRRSQVLVR